jgi:tRNA threonylcarbamoyl adenosine modification protein YeaZ
VLDSGSPLVSVALGRPGGAAGREASEVLAVRAVEISRSSRQLLEMIDEVLAEVGARPRDLAGVAALRGPGSFTGLRIGLSTVLGLHQALGMPATAISTLEVLAAAVDPLVPVPETVVAAVDALRGDWSAQAFTAGSPPRPLTGMELVPGAALPTLGGATMPLIAGFGVGRLAELTGWPADVLLYEPGPLAPVALGLLGPPGAVSPGTAWEPALLTSPTYSRPPAVTVPTPRPSGSSGSSRPPAGAPKAGAPT